MTPFGSSYVPYGIFFFNSRDEGISGNYDHHGKKVVRERVAVRDRSVLNSDFLVHHGDILGGNGIRAILSGSCKSDRLDTTLKRAFVNSTDPGYIPYAIGMFGIPLETMEHADDLLRRDNAAGYKGVIMFILENADQAMQVGNYLSLPLTELNSR